MPFHPVECDGFDNYADTIERWTIGNGGSNFSGASRHAWGQGLGYQFNTIPQIEHVPLGEVIHEFAWRDNDAVSSFVLCRLGKLDVLNRYHLGLHVSESGHPYFARYDSSNNLTAIIAGPTTGPEHILEPNVWYWMQVLAGFHESSGYVKLMVNNHVWLEATGVNTMHGGYLPTPTAEQRTSDTIRLGEFPMPTIRVDDWVLQDGSDGVPQGDMVVIGKRPIAAGYITQLDLTGAATNHEAVDEIDADGDTSYVSSDTIGERDSYIIEDITEVPESSIVLGVQLAYRHSKEQPGPRSVRGFVRVASDEYLEEERFPSENFYLTSIEEVHILQPDLVSEWGTVGEFNDLDVEIGVEVGDGFDDES